MRASDIPVVAWLAQGRPGDPVFDAFMVLGPVLILVIALVGRTAVTSVLAGLYVSSFVVYVVYNGFVE